MNQANMTALKQVAIIAGLRLLGLAVCEEIARDYVRFRANSIHTIERAMAICEEITNQFGIEVSAAY